jgi:hypothetical protein
MNLSRLIVPVVQQAQVWVIWKILIYYRYYSGTVQHISLSNGAFISVADTPIHQKDQATNHGDD